MTMFARLLRLSRTMVLLSSIIAPGTALSVSFEQSATVTSFCTMALVGICNNSRKRDFQISMPVPRDVASPGKLRLEVWGDFNSANEYIRVSVEGFSLGTFLNDNPRDDLFDHRTAWLRKDDMGSEYGQPKDYVAGGRAFQRPEVGIANIPEFTLRQIALDGMLTISFILGPGVSNGPCCNHLFLEEFVSATISFDTISALAALSLPTSADLFSGFTSVPPPIPIPPSVVLLASSFGFLLLTVRRRESRRRIGTARAPMRTPERPSSR